MIANEFVKVKHKHLEQADSRPSFGLEELRNAREMLVEKSYQAYKLESAVRVLERE